VPVWKELKLDELLAQGVDPTHETLNKVISEKFPLDEQNLAKDPLASSTTRAHNPKYWWTNQEWRDLLKAIYSYLLVAKKNDQKDSIKSYLAEIQQLPDSHNQRIYDVWKLLGLNKDLENQVAADNPMLLAKIDNKYPLDSDTLSSTQEKESIRDLGSNSSSYMTKDEEEMLIGLLSVLAKLGYPMEKGNLHDLCNAYLRKGNRYKEGRNCISIDTIEQLSSTQM
jgi:hypothetical protein